MKRRWRSSCSTNHEFDLFDYRDEFIGTLTDKQLEDELKRRKEANESVTKERMSYYAYLDIEISDYYEEALEYSGDDELIQELESRGMYVYDKSIPPHFTGDLKDLARFVGLKWWSTKEQIMNEINFLIGDGK